MAKYSNTVEYNIKTSLDSAGIVKLQTELSKIENQFRTMRNQGLVGKTETKEALANIELIRSSLSKAFNGKLGMLDNKAFLANLNANGKSIASIGQSFAAMGTQGTAAFTRMYGQISRIDTGLKQVSSTSDKIMNTLGNTVRWGLIASAFSQVMNAAHQSVQYVEDLDKSLTNIMMVSQQTKENMNDFAKQANLVAQRLGATTTQMTEATKVFVQQGMSLSQSSQMAEYSVHLANISEQDSATTADELTAMKNAFKINIDDMGNAISKWAVIANNTAVDMEELSVASQKAASVANTVGVSMDQFAGHIAAIEATTREAPENIGNGLKTLYSRLADIKLGKDLEDGVDLGQFSSALKKVGVDVLDTSGKMRDVGTIIEDLMVKWGELDQTQRNAVATTVAGRFQLARFEALMNSQDIYRTATNVAAQESGTETYDMMQETYRNSLEGRMNALTSSIEAIFLKAFNTDDFYGLVDVTTQLVQVFGDLIEAVGGGSNALTALAALITKGFSNQIGQGISNFISNRQTQQLAASNKASVEQNARAQLAMRGMQTTGNANADNFINTTAAVNQYAGIMNPEQIKTVNAELQKYEEQIIALDALQQESRELTAGLGEAFVKLGMSEEVADKGAKELAMALEKTEGDLEGAKKLLSDSGFMKVAEQIENAQLSLVQFSDTLEGVTADGVADWDKIQNGAGKLKNKLEAVASEMRKAGGDTTKLNAAIEQLSRMLTGDVSSMEKFNKALAEGNLDLNLFREGIVKVFENCENLNTALNQNTERLHAVGAATQTTQAKIMGMAQSFNVQNITTNLVNMGSALMSFTFTVQSIKALFEVWNNEDLNPFEKLEQSLLNISMIAVMGIPMFGQMGGAIKVLKAEALEYLAVQTASNLQTTEEVALTGTKIAVLGTENAAKENLIASSLILASSEGKVSIATIQEIAAQEGLTVAQVAGIASANGLAISVRSLWAAFLASPLAPIAAAMLAVTVTVGALVAIIKTGIDQYNRFDIAVENARERLSAINKQTSEAKNKVSELSSVLTDLKDNDPFKGLTKGTQEWNQALIETNQKILDLIEKYPDLANFVTKGKNGELTFSSQGMENYIKETQQHLAASQLNAARAGQELTMAQNQQAAINALRSNNFKTFLQQNNSTSTEPYNTKPNIKGQMYTDAQTSSNNEAAAAEQLQQVATYMVENLNKDEDELKEDLRSLGITNEKTISELIAHKTELAQLGNTIQSNNVALEAATNAYTQAALSTNEKFSELSAVGQNYVQKELQNALGSDFQYGDNQYVNAAVSKFDNSGLTWDNGKLQEWYAQQNGYKWDKNDQKFYTQDNQEVKGLDETNLYKEIRDAYIADALVKQFTEHAPEMAAPVENAFKHVSETAGEDIANIFDGQGGFNKEGLARLEQDKTYDLSGLTSDDIHALGFSDIDTPEQLRDKLQQYLEENPIEPIIDAESVQEQLQSITKEQIDSDINLEDFQALSDYLATNAEELEGFDGELEENADLVKEVAEEMLEYDSALERAQKSMEDWEDLLSSDAVEDHAKAASELNEVYKDLLDLADDTNLSAAFTTNPENLELLKQAMEGNVEAYDELAARAAQDILIQAGIDTDTAQADVAYLQTLIDQSNYNEIEIGAHVDSTALVEELNEIIAAADMTASEAESLLASMGLEGELEMETQQQETPQTYVNWDTHLEPVEEQALLPTSSGDSVQPSTVRSYSVVTTPSIQTIPGQATGAVFGLKMTGTKTGATSGGGIKIKSGSLRKAATGAAKFANASHGGGASAPKSSGGGGNNGGGGNGNKAEEPKDVAHKEAGEAEKDIYEKIDAWLEKLQDDYSKLKKARENAWGEPNVIKNANKALGLLQSEKKALEDRIGISKKYQKALLGDEKLKKKYNVKNSLDEYGLTDKDMDGVVDNYSQQWDIAKRLAEKAQKEADDYFKAHGGQTGKDQYGNTIITKDAQMLEADANHYEELTKTAENAWEIVKQINDVTKEYEDTANEIRDDEEKQLDVLYEMDEIQIEMYERALDALDTLEDMHDLMAKMKGMWSGFELDSPFRAMVEDVQEIKDLFAGDTKKEINDYYKNIYDNIAKNDRLSKKEKDQATKFFKQEQKNATSKNGYNNLGFGEMAAEARKLAELQAMETNIAVRTLVYGPTEEGYKKWKDALEEQAKKVQDLALSAEEAWDKAQENIIDALDEELDKLNEVYDKYDDIIDRVEREADRISLFHGDDQYDDLSKLADQTGKVQLEKAKQYQEEYDYWEKKQNALKEEEERERNRRINEAKQNLANASNAQERKEAELLLEQANQYHSDEWEWYDEQMREAQKNVLDAQDEAAEAFKDAYEYALDEIEAKWLESALGTRDTNYLEDDWNRDKDYMTTYKDDYERNYEVQKLNYKWQQMLNDALGSSLATQRKIRNEGQAIVDQLATQTTMSEYDVKLANARLEILQKQIALENAQQNKNQMKLRRDTQGNYKYIYAADQNDVGEKQQDLLDSIYDVWEISKDQSIGSTDNYIEAVQNAGEKAKEIWNDASLTIEQKQALIAELMADTGRLLEAISEDAGDSFNGMISAVTLGAGIGLENVQEMCANVLDALLTHNEETIEGIGVPWDQFLGDLLVPEDGKPNIPGIETEFKKAMDGCLNANQGFLDKIKNPETGVAAVTKEEYGKASDVIKNTTGSTNDLYNETLKLYTLFGMESKALDEAKKTMEGYKKALDSATSGSGVFAKQVQAANKSIVDAAKESGNWITAPEKAAKTAKGRADPYAFSSSGVSIPRVSVVSGNGGGISSSGGGSGSAGGSGGIAGGIAGGVGNEISGPWQVWNDHGDLVSSGSLIEATLGAAPYKDTGLHFKNDNLKWLGFATGGYTGSWSDNGVDEKNGKFAILHQKELVLNAADTKNILTAVELVRQSTDLLKNASLSDAISKSGGIITQTGQSDAIVSQPVTISAEFPNANSVNEIKEALLSLTDAASQYAYRVGGASPSTGRFTQGTYF